MICSQCGKGKLWLIRMLPTKLAYQCDTCDQYGYLPRSVKGCPADQVQFGLADAAPASRYEWLKGDVTIADELYTKPIDDMDQLRADLEALNRDIRASQHPI